MSERHFAIDFMCFANRGAHGIGTGLGAADDHRYPRGRYALGVHGCFPSRPVPGRNFRRPCLVGRQKRPVLLSRGGGELKR